MSFAQKLYEKPIHWGSNCLQYATVLQGTLQTTRIKPNKTYFLAGIREIVLSPQLSASLERLSKTQVRLLHFNIRELSEHLALPRWYDKICCLRNPKEDSDLLRLAAIIETSVEEVIFPRKMALPAALPKNLRSIYDRVAYIFGALRDDYCVCLHAQSTHFMPYYWLLKELERIENPNCSLDQMKVLRSNKFLYLHEGSDIVDPQKLSVDVIPLNQADAESAFYFIRSNSNNWFPTTILDKLLPRLLKSYNAREPQQEEIRKKLDVLRKKVVSHSNGVGSMLLVCIPKAAVASEGAGPLVLTAPFGDHYELKGRTQGELVDLLQEGLVDQVLAHLYLQKKEEKREAYAHQIQGRLEIPLLTRENGVKIFRISEVPVWLKRECREAIQEIAKELVKVQGDSQE